MKNERNNAQKEKYKMTSGKYDKFIVEQLPRPNVPGQEHQPHAFGIVRSKPEHWKNLDLQFIMSPISSPWFMVGDTHKHDFDQILCFMGGDSSNVYDFQAEIELCLGDEAEKYIINKASMVYIPKGLAHCPLNFKVISKPIIFLDIRGTWDYTRRVKKDGEWELISMEEVIRREDAITRANLDALRKK
jgi:hypothetical protein